jgi:hypothetical protein
VFEILQVGRMCHVLVDNLFVVGMPRLVHFLLSICNQFGQICITSKWELILKLHKKYLEKKRMFKGHVSNDNSSSGN